MLELARHLTERDREIALVLYRHRVLTTDQLRLLFFSSTRRAQDRLLLLYRHRVVDRFYPPLPFGRGKPEAHWLLDEGGAVLVAAALGVERRQLGWERRDDWGSHPQLAHRLETNRFVTNVIAATLADRALGVVEWWSTSEAAARIGNERTYGRVLPDTGFAFATPRGTIECYLEWDRGTETEARLADKLIGYRIAEAKSDRDEHERCSILFVVPGAGRLRTLQRAFAALERDRERRVRDRVSLRLNGRWPVLAAAAIDVRDGGPLAPVWQRLDHESGRPHALAELPAQPAGHERVQLDQALGRRWRKEHPEFWTQLSPLAATPIADGQRGRGGSEVEADLRLSAPDGLMPDPDDDPEEEQWP